MDTKKYQAFVFDMDGTIVSSIEDIGDAVNYSLAFHGLPTRRMEEFPAFLGNGSVKLIERALGDKNQAFFRKVFDTYYSYYLEHYCVKTHPYDDIVESLTYAKKQGILLFVYTNKPENIAKEVSDHCFGKGFFDALVGIPLGGKVKPDPEAFQKAVMVPYGLDPRRCAYFGDSLTDIQTARNLGIERMYAVSWGYVEKEKLLKGRPYRLLERPEEIQDVVKGTI